MADPNTGLTKDGERWYDPQATVWLGVDPAGFAAMDSNLTRYVGNGPTNTIDPSGLWGFWEWWYGNGFLNQRGKKLDEQRQEIAIKRALANDTLVDDVNKIRTMGYSDAACEAKALANVSIQVTASAPALCSTLPITGFTRHGINSAISHAGGGVPPWVIKNTVSNPVQTILQPNGTYKIVGQYAVVVLNQCGKVVTTYPLGPIP